MSILIVLTSHNQLGNTGRKTGVWLEEFTAPYYVFKDAGEKIVIASPAGGKPPLDPKSDESSFQTATTTRFSKDAEAQRALAHTVKLSSVIADDFDAIFYPGGHGPLWDLAEDPDSIALIETFFRTGKLIGAVCHAPAIFRHTKNAAGEPLVKGKQVTGFSNSEEEAVELTRIVPFLVEDLLIALGGIYTKGPDWGSFIQTDGRLITGQNPASSDAAARSLLKLLG